MAEVLTLVIPRLTCLSPLVDLLNFIGPKFCFFPREPAVKIIENPLEDLTTPTVFTGSDNDELPAVEEGLVLETWKGAFSLCERRCGAIKRNNERCKLQIGAKQMEKLAQYSTCCDVQECQPRRLKRISIASPNLCTATSTIIRLVASLV